MNQNMTFDREAALATAREIDALASEIRNIFDNLNNDVESNINNVNVWSGEAATRFKNAWNNYASNFNNFVNIFTNVEGKISSTTSTVSNFENN